MMFTSTNIYIYIAICIVISIGIYLYVYGQDLPLNSSTSSKIYKVNVFPINKLFMIITGDGRKLSQSGQNILLTTSYNNVYWYVNKTGHLINFNTEHILIYSKNKFTLVNKLDKSHKIASTIWRLSESGQLCVSSQFYSSGVYYIIPTESTIKATQSDLSMTEGLWKIKLITEKTQAIDLKAELKQYKHKVSTLTDNLKFCTSKLQKRKICKCPDLSLFIEKSKVKEIISKMPITLHPQYNKVCKFM